jgi:hypothetical protein
LTSLYSYNNEKELLASGILQMILGTGVQVKYGSGGGSNKLSSAVAQASNNKCAVSSNTGQQQTQQGCGTG